MPSPVTSTPLVIGIVKVVGEALKELEVLQYAMDDAYHAIALIHICILQRPVLAQALPRRRVCRETHET